MPSNNDNRKCGMRDADLRHVPDNLQENLDLLGEVLLQDHFTVWDPKQIIKKGRERHIFLFEMCLVVAKEVKDSNGKSRYAYKFKLMVSARFVSFVTKINT